MLRHLLFLSIILFTAPRVLADNLLMTVFQPQISVGLIRPVGSLWNLFDASPLIQLGLATPYTSNAHAYLDIGYSLLTGGEAEVEVHAIRNSLGLMVRPSLAWLPQVGGGLAYHYLRTAHKKNSDIKSRFLFVDDSESEFGVSIKGEWLGPKWGRLGFLFHITSDLVFTEPRFSALTASGFGVRF